MAAEPLIILLLVASSEVGENVTFAMSASAREALGAESQVIVENLRELPRDEEALARGERVRARAVVELRKMDATRMRLHAHLRGQDAWVDRTLTFANIDDPSERGRTAGLAIASMMPLEWRSPPQPGPPAVKGAETLSPKTLAPSPAGGRGGGAQRWIGVVDISGLAAVGGEGAAWGGQLLGRVHLGPVVGVHVLGGARFGSVSDADADALTIVAGSGVALRVVRAERWELALSGDVLALRQELHRGEERASRWVLGAQMSVEGVFFFTRHVGAVATVSEEVGFGATRVFVGPDRVATLPPFRTLFKVGIRVRF